MPNEIDEILDGWREVCDAATDATLVAKEDFGTWVVRKPGGSMLARFVAKDGRANAELFALSRTAFPRAIEALEETQKTLKALAESEDADWAHWGTLALAEQLGILKGETEKRDDDTA